MELKSSFTEVDSKAVAKACHAFIADRVESIHRRREAVIDADMARRFFRPKSREAARKAREAEWVDPLHEIRATGAYWDSKVRDLLHLATISTSGVVYLTAEDAAVIARYMPSASGSTLQANK